MVAEAVVVVVTVVVMVVVVMVVVVVRVVGLGWQCCCYIRVDTMRWP